MFLCFHRNSKHESTKTFPCKFFHLVPLFGPPYIIMEKGLLALERGEVVRVHSRFITQASAKIYPSQIVGEVGVSMRLHTQN